MVEFRGQIDFAEPLPVGERIVFREWSDEDQETILSACRDSDIGAWTSMPEPSPETVETWIGQLPESKERGSALHLAIIDRGSDSIIGNAGFVGFDWKHSRAEVGYWILPEWREQGYATEALRLVTKFAFSSLSVERVDLFVDPSNVGSKAVAEKAGYTYEGRLRSFRTYAGQRADLDLYSRLRTDH